MTLSSLLKRPSAFLPLAMSAAACALLVGFLATFGLVHQEDEGLAARVFQLLLIAQLPIVAVFAASWVPRAPRQAMVVLSLHLLAAATAVVTVLFLEG